MFEYNCILYFKQTALLQTGESQKTKICMQGTQVVIEERKE